MEQADTVKTPQQRSHKRREKKYVMLSKETVQIFSEQVGHADLGDEVAGMLAEDVTFRLREATQNACQYMKHAKRRCLTTDDFNRALKQADVKPLYGHGSGDSFTFRHTREGEVSFIEDPDINDLSSVASSNKFKVQTTGEPVVDGQWLVVQGQQKQGVQTPAMPPVCPELMTYYDNMTKAILSNDVNLMKVAFKDLRTNDKISTLIPHFINFTSSMRLVSHDIRQMTKLLLTIKNLISNPSLFLEPKPFLQLLLDSLFYCILDQYPASIDPINDHWTIRHLAARLMALITKQWSNEVNQIYQQNISRLEASLLDSTQPLCSHYGALLGFWELGSKAIWRLVPLLDNLMTQLQAIATKQYNKVNNQLKYDAQSVEGVILHACEMLMADIIRGFEASDQQTHHTTSNDIQLYSFIYELFGDRLISRLPMPILQYTVADNLEYRITLGDKDSTKTGEELLAQFLVADVTQEEEMTSDNTDHVQDELEDEKSWHSERSEKSDHSYNSDDMSSSGGLAIKKTVDDPTLGRIKLVIARLKPDKSSKSKKKRVHSKLYEVFEQYVHRRYHTRLSFNIRELAQVSRMPRLAMVSDRSTKTNYRTVCARLPLYSKKASLQRQSHTHQSPCNYGILLL